MEPWKLTLLFGVVQFAMSFGGLVAAMRYVSARVDRAEASASRAHDRISHHIEAHAEGKF